MMCVLYTELWERIKSKLECKIFYNLKHYCRVFQFCLSAVGFNIFVHYLQAMHLVYKALEKEPVPMKLPADLVPPGKRRKPSIMGGVPVLPPLAVSGRNSPAAVAPAVTASPARKSSVSGVCYH